MAKIIGTSDTWKSICLVLNGVNFIPEKPSDIHDFFEATKKEYALAKTNATQDVQDTIESLKNNIEQWEKNFDNEIRRGRDEIIANIELTQLVLQLLQVDLIQKVLNYFKIRAQKEKLKNLKNTHKNYPGIFQQKIEQAKSTLEKTKNNFDVIIEKQCQTAAHKVRLLENVLKSPELAGAIAELEVIDSLKSLPNNCFVINDVFIELRRAIHFDGQWLKSAQIDHVVVTSSGIFVIEVKNWSSKFVQEGDYFSPYQQIKRSSYLCYKLIGERYNLKTRSIVAYKGSIPSKLPDSYSKALPINEVKGYISWFKDSNVSDQIVEIVANWFANKSN